MADNDKKAIKERNSLKIYFCGAGLAILGTILLVVSYKCNWLKGHENFQAIIMDMGGLLFVSATITLVWDFFLKRAFLDEILSKANISKELSFAGIIKISDSFHNKDIDWSSYFKHVKKLDIFFAYGRTWRNNHNEELQRLALSNDVRIRVVLPNPDDEITISELSRKFDYTKDQLKELINETKNYFIELSKKQAKISIWLLPLSPYFSFYRFDYVGILALYTHRKDRASVPTFVCDEGGTLYNYIRQEFAAMIGTKGSTGLAKCILLDGEEPNAE